MRANRAFENPGREVRIAPDRRREVRVRSRGEPEVPMFFGEYTLC